MSSTCSICCDDFNRSDRAAVPCELGDCDFRACKTCTRQYLLGTTLDPHCMNCRKAWSQEYLVTHLNHSWMAKDYRQHRKKLLLDREISRVPECMAAAERTRRCRDKEQEALAVRLEIARLDNERRALQERLSAHYREMRQIRDGKDGEFDSKRKFIMACPNTDCRGYLSTAYKCEICALHTCKACLEVIGYKRDDPHECNPDSVKSAELIRSDTHPCPTCGERIFKISGCDQMWCPHCSTAFSWKTGKVDTGLVHNPHFYEAQRARNNGQAPRNPNDVLCGGLMHWHAFRRTVLDALSLVGSGTTPPRQELCAELQRMHRAIAHLTHDTLPAAREKVRALASTEELRIEYILGDRDKKSLADTVIRNDRLRAKWTEFLHLYELMSVVGIETFMNIRAASRDGNRRFTAEGIAEIEDHVRQCHGVRQVCNAQFARVSAAYSVSVPQWDDSWTVRRHKFTTRALRAAAEGACAEGACAEGACAEGACAEGACAEGACAEGACAEVERGENRTRQSARLAVRGKQPL